MQIIDSDFSFQAGKFAKFIGAFWVDIFCVFPKLFATRKIDSKAKVVVTNSVLLGYLFVRFHVK